MKGGGKAEAGAGTAERPLQRPRAPAGARPAAAARRRGFGFYVPLGGRGRLFWVWGR